TRSELRRARVRNVVRTDRVEGSVGEGGPDRVDVLGLAERRLADPERGVGPRELRARQIQIERPRLAEHADATTLALAKRVECWARAEMHQIDRRACLLGEVDGLAHGLHLGLDRATRRE